MAGGVSRSWGKRGAHFAPIVAHSHSLPYTGFMAKHRAKAFPPAPPPQPSALTTRAEQVADAGPTLPPFATDPLDAYDMLKHDVYCRRKIVWDIYRSNEDAQSIKSAIVGALADSEIIITSTKPASQQTNADRDEAKRLMRVINNAMGRRGGALEFINGFVDGFLGCVTGAMVENVYDRNGDVVEIGIIDPMCTRPYYWDGFTYIYDIEGREVPVGYLEPKGITFRGRGGFYTSLPAGLYYQATYGALGRGAWIVGRPLAEENLQTLTLGTALNQFLRKSVYGLDAAQVMVMSFVDTPLFLEQVRQRKEALKNKPSNPDERGNVLVVTQNNPDKKAEIEMVNLRGVPEGVPLLDIMDMISAKTAKGFGVKASRTATLNDKARYAGSGSQAAQQESDEWGLATAKNSLLSYYQNYLLDGKPFTAKIMGTDDPKSYARAAYEQTVSQTASQLFQIYSNKPEVLEEFLVTRGVTPPSSVGAIAVTQSAMKATSDDEQVVDDSVELCAQDIGGLWLSFIQNDIPRVIDRYGVNEPELDDELRDISQLIIAQVIRCIRDAAGNIRDAYIRNLERQARDGLTNLIGRPQDWGENNRPLYPAHTEIMRFSPMLAVGTAGLADVQNRLVAFGKYVTAYANLSRQANWYALGQTNADQGVDWVRTVAESCPDCVAFEGHYSNMADLLERTNGRLPGSPALADKGHCKCYLAFTGG